MKNLYKNEAKNEYINKKFYNKTELYDFLKTFDYNQKKETSLSSLYFLVKYNDTIEPLYFTPFRDVWFASPCEIHSFELGEKDLEEFVESLYEESSQKEALEFEKLFQRNGIHYDIDNPQVTPFLPDEITIIKALSETECLNWFLEREKENE